MHYSACIEMLFGEVPFTERIGKAKDAGFSHVEFWLWKPKDMGAIKAELDRTKSPATPARSHVGARPRNGNRNDNSRQ